MGRYINENSKGDAAPSKGKTKFLIEDGATICDPQVGAVCVVDNGAFDAACYIYNVREFSDMSLKTDRRPKVWLKYKHAETLAK